MGMSASKIPQIQTRIIMKFVGHYSLIPIVALLLMSISTVFSTTTHAASIFDDIRQGTSNKSLSNSVLAFDMDRAQPNRMTPEKSKEIYDNKQEEDKSSSSTNTSDDTNPDKKQRSSVDPERVVANELSAEQSREIYRERQVALLVRVAVVATIIVGAISLLLLLLKKRRNRKQDK